MYVVRLSLDAQADLRLLRRNLPQASVSAPKLVKALYINEALGYTDTKNLTSTQLFRLLDEHYDLAFDVRTFQIARSK